MRSTFDQASPPPPVPPTVSSNPKCVVSVCDAEVIVVCAHAAWRLVRKIQTRHRTTSTIGSTSTGSLSTLRYGAFDRTLPHHDGPRRRRTRRPRRAQIQRRTPAGRRGARSTRTEGRARRTRAAPGGGACGGGRRGLVASADWRERFVWRWLGPPYRESRRAPLATELREEGGC